MRYLLIKLLKIEKKYRSFFIVLLLLVLYIPLYKPLIEKLLIAKVAPYLNLKSSNYFDTFFAIFLLLVGAGFIGKLFYSFWKKKVTLQDFFWPSIFSVIYFLHRFEIILNDFWVFTEFNSIKELRYFDGVYILILLISFKPKKSLRSLSIDPRIPELYEDDLIQRNGGNDLFKRSNYASYISKLILNQRTKTSFAIGVKGSWGSGKSVFLKQIEDRVHNVVKIRFNPWLSKNSADVLDDFFKVLVETTLHYDRNLSRSLKNYYNNLSNLDDSYLKKLLSVFGFAKSSNELSLGEQQNEIISKLKDNKLKIVVFIDDLDRLSPDEILSILRLVRNSFNFPNTFFLIAYDENYIHNTLADEIKNPEKFLEKIFQLEINLPSFPNYIVADQLISLLANGKTEIQKKKVGEVIRSIRNEPFFKQTLHNMRDVIRFANSFNHIFWKKETEVDYYDFILVELLKLRNRSLFNELRDSLSGYSEKQYLVYPNQFDSEKNSIEFVNAQTASINFEDQALMKLLFNREDNFDKIKSLRYMGNSLRYFADDLFGNISYAEFDSYKDETFDRFKELILREHANNNLDELTSKITRLNIYINTSSFFNLNKALLLICHLQNDYNYVITVYLNFLREYSRITSALSVEEFELFATQLFSSQDYDPLAESQVLGEILNVSSQTNKADNVPNFDVVLFRSILINNLKLFIQRNSDAFNLLVFDVYYKLINRLENNRVVIDKEANELLKVYVLSHPETYLKRWLIRPQFIGSSNSNTFVLEPFINQYLGHFEFENLLFAQKTNFEILMLQSFFREYRWNKFQAIVFDFNKIDIVSDPITEFLKSPDFSYLPAGKSVVRSEKNSFLRKQPTLKLANWIAHERSITMDQAVAGGVYVFKRSFNLRGAPSKLSSAILYFLVDDFISFEVNGNKIENDQNSYEVLGKIEVTDYINGEDHNEILFYVRNVSSAEMNLQGDPNNNPYEFVYKLQLYF